jgi:hypothetical protein
MTESIIRNQTDNQECINQIDLAYEMTKLVDEDFIEYVYRGNFTENITGNILNLTEAKFVNDVDIVNSKKRISYLLIESLQNVIRHHDKIEDDKIKSKSLFVIQKTSDSIYITTANIIKNKKVEAFDGYLKRISSMSQEELKKEYHAVLNNGIISEKGGGGLGIITMARRSDGHIHYRFETIDEKYSYYYFQIRLIFSENSKPELSQLVDLDRISKFHTILNKENILLNFNGSFAFKNLESMLPIIEAHSVGGMHVMQKVFNLTVKLLRNIVNYADEFEEDESNQGKNSRGVFLLSKKGGRLMLTAGNLILNDKVIILKNKIDILNHTTNESLIKIKDYLEKFYFEDINNKPDISLIEMKLNNEKDIHYQFVRLNSKTSYFIIQLVINS